MSVPSHEEKHGHVSFNQVMEGESSLGIILVEGYVGYDDLTVGKFEEQFNKLLKAGCQKFEMTINSLGGSVTDAWGIYDFIRQQEVEMTAKVLGVAASA
ncbi:MAG: ATP-dependent Clp protease proteolytic subunit, partial [Akkermansia sp.]